MSKTLLIIDDSTNWYEVFGRHPKLPNGDDLKIEQTEWKLISTKAAKGKAYVNISPSPNPFLFTNQKEERLVVPDMLLVRNVPINIHNTNYLNHLLTFAIANTPAVNAVQVMVNDLNRPLLHSELLKIEKRLIELHHGDAEWEKTRIKVVDLEYNSNQGDAPSFGGAPVPEKWPQVVKVATIHGGYGKTVVHDKKELKDVASVIAVGNSYYTVEPFLNENYQVRVQYINGHIRAFRTRSEDSWKYNWGTSEYKDVEVLPRYKEWAEEAHKIWGGLDMFAIDIIMEKDGSETIIEINVSAIGITDCNAKEDVQFVKELIMEKMDKEYYKK
ncbi:synapsin, putative [Entamoeba invadens IP1]|uniref:Synapsin, putative n=1 Tax=Entamoeba invadens IP1 TaxID=370355 RepID=L7FPE7_ENTIV|nr:synapsin, putative [Entamoeba invadens IP1]ELP94545.1 synapsin, putative [Entamoeba invadens IP1]|eukprot:XP_004261316.1 synapsin, putative [Entamoeba invadens IP1]